LDGIDAVVNCVGVLQDGAGDDTRRIHVEASCALFDACLQHGIRRVIQMSAIGADPAGPSEFSRTKAAADAHLQSLDLDWVILRPALVLAPAASGGPAPCCRPLWCWRGPPMAAPHWCAPSRRSRWSRPCSVPTPGFRS